MAAPEQVGIATEIELNRLASSVKQAAGEDAEALGEYPRHYIDRTLLEVEQLRWVNSALEVIGERAVKADRLVARLEDLEGTREAALERIDELKAELEAAQELIVAISEANPEPKRESEPKPEPTPKPVSKPAPTAPAKKK